jgi:hypothetical protein
MNGTEDSSRNIYLTEALFGIITLSENVMNTIRLQEVSSSVSFAFCILLYNKTYLVLCSKYWMLCLFAHCNLSLPKHLSHSNFSRALLLKRKQAHSSDSHYSHRYLPSYTGSFHHHLFQPESIITLFLF